MSDGPRTSEGQRVPGPLGLLHPLRTGDELVPGATVQRAWVWHGRFIFVVGDRRLIVEPPRPDGRYYVRTAKYGIYAEGRVDPEAELSIESGMLPKKKGGKLSVVEAARMRRINQVRRERLPEASLFFAQRANDGPLEGKLQIRGDAGMMML